MKKDSRIFKASEIDVYKTGWVADLSGENIVNPDCYWYFDTKKAATEFIKLVDGGMDAKYAAHKING